MFTPYFPLISLHGGPTTKTNTQLSHLLPILSTISMKFLYGNILMYFFHCSFSTSRHKLGPHLLNGDNCCINEWNYFANDKARCGAFSLTPFVFCFVCLQRQGLSVLFWLPWNLWYRPGCLQTYRDPLTSASWSASCRIRVCTTAPGLPSPLQSLMLSVIWLL